MRRLMVPLIVLALAVCALPAPAFGQEIPLDVAPGYGPWTFGMSEAEVAAVEAHAPYDPVLTSIGGLETFTGLDPALERVSFVFTESDQLYMIRLWYDFDMEEYESVLRAFHSAYRYITETFGSSLVDTGYPLEPGMPAEEFISLIPDRFAPTGEEFEFGGEGAPTEFEMEQRQLQIYPVNQPAGAQVWAVLAKLHPTTMYMVQVYYRWAPQSP